MKKLSENEIWVWFIHIYSHFSVDKDSIFGELGGNGLGGAFRGGVGNFLGGFGSLGTGGALTTLPVVGDFRQFNQALSGKCIIVGSPCKAANAVCAALVASIQDVGVCKCKAGYIAVAGDCYPNAYSFPSDTTLFPSGIDLG